MSFPLTTSLAPTSIFGNANALLHPEEVTPRLVKKRRYNEDEDAAESSDLPAKPTRVARIPGLRNSRASAAAASTNANIAANTSRPSRAPRARRASRTPRAPKAPHNPNASRSATADQVDNGFNPADPGFDEDRAIRGGAAVGGKASLRKVAASTGGKSSVRKLAADLPAEQLQDPDILIQHAQNFAEAFKARIEGYEATIQQQKDDLDAAQGVIRTQKNDLASAQKNLASARNESSSAKNTIRELEAELVTLRQVAPASIEIIGGQQFHRDGPLSANPGLLRRREIGLFEWSGKTWKKERTLRELELVVESDQDPVKMKAGGEIYQQFKSSDGAPEIMVCCRAETVVIDGHPFYERDVMVEVRGVDA